MPLGQHFGEFVAYSLPGNLPDLVSKFPNGGKGRRLDLIFKPRRKAYRAEHAQFVFGKAAFGIADGTDNSSIQVIAPAYEIEHLVINRIQK